MPYIQKQKLRQKPKDRNIHRPKHIYKNKQIYFITGKTYWGIDYFCTDKRKSILCKIINVAAAGFDVNIYGWAVLDNHYHLLLEFSDNKDNEFHSKKFEFNSSNHNKRQYSLVEFIRKTHKDSSRIINGIDGFSGRKVWYQYWDRFIRSEKEFFGYLNYIHFNPIKHKKISRASELSGYKYSSFNQYVNRYGFEWVFEKYSIIN